MYEEEARALHNLLNTASDPSKPSPTPEPDLLALFGLNAPGGAALKIPGDPAGLPSHSDGACYLFRIDDEWIVDATTTGGPARFVNHCCEPNCYSKVIVVDGDKHIVIMSARALAAGEELTYDYKFAVEVEPGAKIVSVWWMLCASSGVPSPPHAALCLHPTSSPARAERPHARVA